MSGEKRRGWIQFSALLIQNANFRGFFSGKIFQGDTKAVCVPGINCYSCPGAVGACPVGSLQTFLASRPVKFPYYVLGLLILFGTILGRAVCGFLCPFGFIQELIHKIPLPKKKIGSFPGDRALRKLKYAILLVMVILLPLAMDYTPTFCKYICPAGTLEGGIPLVLFGSSKLNFPAGTLFYTKLAVLILLFVLSLFLFRPFCKYLCPLGAFYGLFNRVSLYRMRPEPEKCTHCGACSAVCPMQVDPSATPNHTECIRCGRCTSACPAGALHLGFSRRAGAAEVQDGER